MQTIPLEAVENIRGRIRQAMVLAAERFRAHFAATPELAPNQRWRGHLEIQAAALLEHAREVRLPSGYRVAYSIDEANRIVQPYVAAIGSSGEVPAGSVSASALYPFFQIARTPEALLEYWLVISEMTASSGWAMTRLVATAAEYDEALKRMKQPQLVRALIVSFLPAAEWRDDGTAVLEATVYTRAQEERIERRSLLLDRNHELHGHGRELIAEGRGGVGV
jgi:hypothetical protein